MTLTQISKKYNIKTDALRRRAGKLKLVRVNGNYTEEQVNLINYPVNKSYLPKNNKLSLNTILLIYEYKEKFPSLSPEIIADMFCINQIKVIDLFLKEFIIVPSKIN
jgi:hypothetical protein